MDFYLQLVRVICDDAWGEAVASVGSGEERTEVVADWGDDKSLGQVAAAGWGK